MDGPHRRWLEAARFLLLFVTCLLLCYGAILLMSDRLFPANPYREPRGNAVKVVKLLNQGERDDLNWYLERLQLFFLVGE